MKTIEVTSIKNYSCVLITLAQSVNRAA
jgi:hypothetical protein